MFDIFINNLSHYIEHPSYKVIKLHGSVNWVHPTRLPIENIGRLSPLEIAHRMIRSIDAASVDLKYCDIQDTFPPNHMETRACLPAIAIPVPAKPTFECPQNHVNVLTEAIPAIDKLIVVGWRGQERHFTGLFKLLRRHVAVLIVAGDDKDAQQTRTALEGAGVKGVYTPYPKGLSNFIRDEHLIDKFLSIQSVSIERG